MSSTSGCPGHGGSPVKYRCVCTPFGAKCHRACVRHGLGRPGCLEVLPLCAQPLVLLHTWVHRTTPALQGMVLPEKYGFCRSPAPLGNPWDSRAPRRVPCSPPFVCAQPCAVPLLMSKSLLRSERNRLPAPREANQIKQSGKEDSLFINLTRSPGDLHSRLEILLQLLLDASRMLLALPRTPRQRLPAPAPCVLAQHQRSALLPVLQQRHLFHLPSVEGCRKLGHPAGTPHGLPLSQGGSRGTPAAVRGGHAPALCRALPRLEAATAWCPL